MATKPNPSKKAESGAENDSVETSGSQSTSKPEATDVCGIVMPISAIDGCPESHWADVLSIHSDAIRMAGYDPNLVSNSDDIGIIQKNIVQNLHNNPVVVVDVSGKNPNVMFELGMRLTFDKPTVIVKDDQTDYSFDTSPIAHLQYPRDLRFHSIVEFKNQLADKIVKTRQAAIDDPNHSVFLKHFGQFVIPTLQKTEVSKEDFIIQELKELKQFVKGIKSQNATSRGLLSSRYFLNDSSWLAEKYEESKVIGRVKFGTTHPIGNLKREVLRSKLSKVGIRILAEDIFGENADSRIELEFMENYDATAAAEILSDVLTPDTIKLIFDRKLFG